MIIRVTLTTYLAVLSSMDFIVSLYLATTIVGSLQKDPTRINVKNISPDSQGWLECKIFRPKNTRIKESKVQTSVGQLWNPTSITFCDNQFENETNGSHPSENRVIDNRLPLKKFGEPDQFYERIRIWILGS